MYKYRNLANFAMVILVVAEVLLFLQWGGINIGIFANEQKLLIGGPLVLVALLLLGVAAELNYRCKRK